jgi:hypothetical protein
MAAINDSVLVGFTMSSVGIAVSKFADKMNLWIINEYSVK